MHICAVIGEGVYFPNGHSMVLICFNAAVPAPFLVIGLGTLGTGKNFLISEGNL